MHTTAAAAARPGDNAAVAMKSVVADPDRYDWEGDLPLERPFAETVIYELHVRGFTRHPSSGVAIEKRGTYAGLIEKIPYLKDLGVTAVELLPVFQFDRAGRARPGRRTTGATSRFRSSRRITRTARARSRSRVLDEFRDMVKALHRAGIEVILDVVFNHTTEGGADGPTLCYRGLANDVYYILEKDKSRYADYTGCGNTLNANQPIVRRLIQDSLRYWVTQMHVDGFRFDLASILSRDEDGRPLPNPPVLWDIEIGSAAGRHQADRRGVGCRRTLSGGKLHRRRAGRSGTAGSATTCGASSEATTARCPASPRGSWAAPTSTATRSARPSKASTS